MRLFVLSAFFGFVHSENYFSFHNVYLINQLGSTGCTISENQIIECDGSSRELNSEDHLLLDEYKQMTEKWKESVNAIMGTIKIEDEGTPIQIPEYPNFPRICKPCLNKENNNI